MASLKSKKTTTKDAKTSNIVAVAAIVALVILAVLDLNNLNDTIPSFIYFGLIGASLGAKIEDIKNWFGGNK